jgi:methylmalonyl-CoA/ethylmalonyl-CoA epimerase
MKPQKIEHIGIAVNSLEESIPLFEKLLGVKCYSIENVKDQFVKTAFFSLGETKIELLESTDPSGPISNFINKNGPGIHHIAFSVKDTDQSLINAKNEGFLLIDRKSRQGAEGMKIGFLHPKSTNNILMEFCSK